MSFGAQVLKFGLPYLSLSILIRSLGSQSVCPKSLNQIQCGVCVRVRAPDRLGQGSLVEVGLVYGIENHKSQIQVVFPQKTMFLSCFVHDLKFFTFIGFRLKLLFLSLLQFLAPAPP